MKNSVLASMVALFQIGALSGCASMEAPENPAGAAWMAQQAPTALLPACHAGVLPEGLVVAGEVTPDQLGGSRLFVSPGDTFRIALAGDDSQVSGTYVVSPDGTLSIPGAGAVVIGGLEEDKARQIVLTALVRNGIARSNSAFLDMRLIESAGVAVSVGGAVFDPGRVVAGARSAEERAGRNPGLVFGDANAGRTVAVALRSAGGVRPDADLGGVILERNGRWARIDYLQMIAGTSAIDPQVQAGDRIYVPSTGCFDARLARPTAVTQPGIRVYMSNLSRPAASNASSAIGKETTSLPYGTRMLQGLVAMNCVGGSAMNAGRRAVLISRNPMTGQSVVIQRRVEELVRAAGRDAQDPYLMPNDALACYDSPAMNVQDVISQLGTITGVASTAAILNRAVP